jgi:hypothetical protein
VAHVIPHVVPSHVVVPLAEVGQGVQDDPHDAVLVPRTHCPLQM